MRPFLALIAAVVAALLLSACNGGDDDPPDAASTWTPSGTIEETQSPTPSTNPLTEAPANETAKQFLKRWVELSNQMQMTGETDAYLAVVGPDCDSCRKFAVQVSDIYDKGGTIDGGQERIVEMKSESRTQWVVTSDTTPTTYVEKAGGSPTSLPGGRTKSRVWLAHVDGHWIVGETEGVPL